jgi:LPXTG-site transpeptidase (sortase) family protein
MNRQLASLVIVSGMLLIAVSISQLVPRSDRGVEAATFEAALGLDVAVPERFLAPVEAEPEASPIEEIRHAQLLAAPATSTTTTTTTTTTIPPQLAEPVGLRIERLDVDAPVDSYGIAPDGKMDIPNNVTDVAWYEPGPGPGEEGSAVLAAHVALGKQGRGVFYDLMLLEPGDLVHVERADGTESAFRVEETTTYLKSELPLETIFSTEGPPVLTLVTCGGDLNPDTRRFNSNVVVYAVPLDSAPGEPVLHRQ